MVPCSSNVKMPSAGSVPTRVGPLVCMAISAELSHLVLHRSLIISPNPGTTQPDRRSGTVRRCHPGENGRSIGCHGHSKMASRAHAERGHEGRARTPVAVEDRRIENSAIGSPVQASNSVEPSRGGFGLGTVPPVLTSPNPHGQEAALGSCLPFFPDRTGATVLGRTWHAAEIAEWDEPRARQSPNPRPVGYNDRASGVR